MHKRGLGKQVRRRYSFCRMLDFGKNNWGKQLIGFKVRCKCAAQAYSTYLKVARLRCSYPGRSMPSLFREHSMATATRMMELLSESLIKCDCTAMAAESLSQKQLDAQGSVPLAHSRHCSTSSVQVVTHRGQRQRHHLGVFGGNSRGIGVGHNLIDDLRHRLSLHGLAERQGLRG